MVTATRELLLMFVRCETWGHGGPRHPLLPSHPRRCPSISRVLCDAISFFQLHSSHTRTMDSGTHMKEHIEHLQLSSSSLFSQTWYRK